MASSNSQHLHDTSTTFPRRSHDTSLLSAALHGVIYPESRVRGTSGAIYAVMFSQLSLLALNWREMPARWLRLIVILVLIAADVSIFWIWRDASISYAGHLFGAVTGVCVALVLGRNVSLERFEILLTWLGFVGYAALVTAAYVGAQTKAATLAVVVP
uniref:Peptidase S54 rhomboid domain-containing protein n=1 Tax=Calcidiscus leptoporus TaxID=127549 RepID=A0A7S0NYJ8_9EUKA|mmetsp:Transcript_36020/g.84121  ORF Transcript_36020/g.84121 Transcript_36020/m.84121 type:complete len:158 (+) Transcript_36020:85-558(+)